MFKGDFSHVNWKVEINKNYTFTALSALNSYITMTKFLPCCYVMLYLAHALWYNAESTSMTWLHCFWYTWQLSNCNIM